MRISSSYFFVSSVLNFRYLLAYNSIYPTLITDLATLVEIAQIELTAVSISSEPLLLYQGLFTYSVLDAIKDKARVVLTPKLCIASDAKNSLTLLLKTALPSPPLQNGVVPPPFSYISHLFPLCNISPIDIALPSPYPFPF